MGMSVFPSCMSVHCMHAWYLKPEKGCQIPPSDLKKTPWDPYFPLRRTEKDHPDSHCLSYKWFTELLVVTNQLELNAYYPDCKALSSCTLNSAYPLSDPESAPSPSFLQGSVLVRALNVQKQE